MQNNAGTERKCQVLSTILRPTRECVPDSSRQRQNVTVDDWKKKLNNEYWV